MIRILSARRMRQIPSPLGPADVVRVDVAYHGHAPFGHFVHVWPDGSARNRSGSPVYDGSDDSAHEAAVAALAVNVASSGSHATSGPGFADYSDPAPTIYLGV